MHKLLTKGKALVIVGPQGSGKTLLAERIAKKVSRRMATEGFGVKVRHFDFNQDFDAVLACRPDVLIIDGRPNAAGYQSAFKNLISSSTVLINKVEVPTPILIFCCTEMPVLDSGQRRFITITLPG